MKALLALEDGRTFECSSFTGEGEAQGEVVFNTSMTGYQEVLTDPSYRGQMVVMTYPLIGNYGTNPEDIESDRIQVSAFLIKEYQDFPSNFRSTQSLKHYLKSQSVMGIENLDTRALTRHIRNSGAMRASISTQDIHPESLVLKTRNAPKMIGQDLARVVTTEKPYFWAEGRPQPVDRPLSDLDQSVWETERRTRRVVAFDFGIKYNILRKLTAIGAQVLVVPADTDHRVVKMLAPDGIFLSNGPGDPEPVIYAVQTIRQLIGYRPIFGICLGHQILGLALGGRTFKLKFGHRGANQPVQNLLTGKIEITSQNHGFAVDVDSVKSEGVEITHLNLNDRTLEGFRHEKHAVLAVQYHPEASPGPHDADYMFEKFKDLMKNSQ